MFKKVLVTLCLIHSVVVTMQLYGAQWRLKKFTAHVGHTIPVKTVFTQLSMNQSNKIINSVNWFSLEALTELTFLHPWGVPWYNVLFFYNREWRQRLRSMSQKHPGWVHQLLNSAPRTLRDDSCCQPCVPPCPPHSCCLREPSWPLKGRITTFYDPKNSIPFFSGKHFLREIRFMQRLGTRKENDPFGGEKRIPPSYFVVRFDSVLLQCIVIFVVCVTEGDHMW